MQNIGSQIKDELVFMKPQSDLCDLQIFDFLKVWLRKKNRLLGGNFKKKFNSFQEFSRKI
jgi:hypothetical protein